ncbi:hypothetical protein, partial [Streptomyces turgidiscabies]|uniref:hypothetical protein n=1 Tax=Streptomyces turgidiscabies TaxID=85558 RepID=UPI0038F81F02
ARPIYLSDEVQAYCEEYGRRIGYGGPIEIEVTRGWMLNRLDFKSELEAIMFPKIIQGMHDAPEQVVEVPLLYELGLEKEFENVWAV